VHQFADSGLMWSWSSLVGAVLGFALWLAMTFYEWRKLTGNTQLPFRQFLYNDQPAIVIAVLSSVILYFAIPSLGTWAFITNSMGFTPKLDFVSAVAVSYLSSSITVKLRNISRKISDE
jgi:magnesium-transporting ATPase (P-type)